MKSENSPLAAKGTAEKIGKTGEQIAEFFAPTGLAGKSSKAIELLQSAAKNAAISGIQEGDTKDAGMVGLTTIAIGGVGAAATKSMKPIKQVLSENVPGRILNSIMKPSSKDFNFGKNPGSAVVKEGITGKSISDLAKNITDKTNEIGKKIGDSVKNIKETIDLQPAIDSIDAHIEKASSTGEQALVSRLQSIRDGLTKTFKNVDGKLVETGAKPIQVTAEKAWEIKKEIGKAAKWTGQAFDNEANKARVDAFRAIGDSLETAAKNAGDFTLGSLNQRYANMITSQKAIERRISSLQRLNKVGFGDITTLGAGGLAGGPVGAIAAAVTRRAVGSTLVQTNVAKLLSKISPEERSAIEKYLPALQKIYLGSTDNSK